MGVAAGEVAARRLLVPDGSSLDADSWARRHRGVVYLLVAQAVALVGFGLFVGANPVHAFAEGLGLVALAVLSEWNLLPRRARSSVAAAGLMSTAGVLTHLSGGYIEAHFHFFVMLGVIFLYEDWLPYTLAVVYVAIHHGLVGTLDPSSVYNHPAAIADPWTWAGIHAAFILGQSATLLAAWSVIEKARRAEATAMAESRGLRRELHAQEKMAALGALAAELAHEVRTPLTVVGANAAIIERRAVGGGPEGVAAPARDIQEAVQRINALVAQLRRFSRPGDEGLVAVSLDAPVTEAVRLFTAASPGAPRVDLDAAPTPPTLVRPLAVQQVVLNLLSNAADACRQGGAVRVRTFAHGGRACLVVEDTGAGMTEETRRRIFEPLFTTKVDGTGLGLAIVKRIVTDHNGEIECTSRLHGGTKFVVTFAPAGGAESRGPGEAPAAKAAAP